VSESSETTSETSTATIESAGSTLQAERSRQSLSVGDVSRHLKLSVRQVEALERNEFEVFGGSVFVHGFLRNYAKLLGLDPGALIEAADRMLKPGDEVDNEASGAAVANSSSQKSLIPLFLVAIIVIAGIIGWILTRESGIATELVPSSEEHDSTSEIVNSLETTAALTEPGADVPITGVASLPPPVERSSSLTASVVRLVFEEESWVEMSDRYGDIIFTDLVAEGETRNISGQPPLSVIIGNAPGVKLTFNEKPIDLASYTQVTVARLTLE